jgi:hypothetical protein
LVTVPVLMFYILIAWASLRTVDREFRDSSTAARLIGTVAVSIAVALVVVVVGGLWSGVSEIIRVGNEHLSFRASRIAWPARAPVWFVLTMAPFWVIAARRAWSSKRSIRRLPPRAADTPPAGSS